MTNDQRKARAMHMFLSGLMGALLVGMWAVAGNAATFELARRADGNIVRGVKVEGDIVPGDARKLLDFYKTYGVMISPVRLRSKGGSVEEAMKMGAIIRRLRLETEVPVWDMGHPPVGPHQGRSSGGRGLRQRLLPCLRRRRKQVRKLSRPAQAIPSKK